MVKQVIGNESEETWKEADVPPYMRNYPDMCGGTEGNQKT
jgi:hypothetical protein